MSADRVAALQCIRQLFLMVSIRRKSRHKSIELIERFPYTGRAEAENSRILELVCVKQFGVTIINLSLYFKFVKDRLVLLVFESI